MNNKSENNQSHVGSSLPRFTKGQEIILSEQGKQTDAVSFSLLANCFKQEMRHNFQLNAYLLSITHDVLKSYSHKKASMGNFHLTIKRKCINLSQPKKVSYFNL